MQIGSYLKLTFNKYTVLQHHCVETKSLKLFPLLLRFSNQKFFSLKCINDHYSIQFHFFYDANFSNCQNS